jgi:hypothetical protein
MSDKAKDLPATIVGLCKNLCDIAHALSRATCMPDPTDDKSRDMIKEAIKEKEKAEALKNELEYQGQEEEDDEVPFEDDPEPEYEDITPGLNSNEDPEQEEEPGPKESKPMNVQELLAKLKNRRDKDDENGG